MSGEVNVISRTQIIMVEPISGSISIINAGPSGPAGPPGISASTLRYVQIGCSNPNGTPITALDGMAYYRVTSELNGGKLTAVYASVSTPSGTGPVTVQIRNGTHGWDMLVVPITIDVNEKDTSTAVAPVIDTASSHDVIATGDQIFIDIDAPGVGAKGLNVELVFTPA